MGNILLEDGNPNLSATHSLAPCCELLSLPYGISAFYDSEATGIKVF